MGTEAALSALRHATGDTDRASERCIRIRGGRWIEATKPGGDFVRLWRDTPRRALETIAELTRLGWTVRS